MEIIKVLIADDHVEFRAAIKQLLLSDPAIKVVGDASDGRQAVLQAKELKPDVVLMDLKMPNMNGLNATRILKREMPTLKIIVTTLYGEQEYRDAAKAIGADGFVAKHSVSSELAVAIRQVMNGELGEGPFSSVPSQMAESGGRWDTASVLQHQLNQESS